MDRLALPQEGQPVTVEIADDAGMRAVFEGLVRAAGSEGVSLSLSPVDDRVEVLAAGMKALVRFADEHGLHYFESPVLEWSAGPRLEVLVGRPPKVASSQRRRFMRLAMRLPIVLARLDRKGDPIEACSAYTLELGGNGAGIVTAGKLSAGEHVRFELDMGEWGVCSGVAVVKRSVLALMPTGAENRVALQFTEIGSKAQALILSYLLAARRKA